MKEVNCEIIQDLLPSYIDNICSKSSRTLVEEHLKSCKKCKAEFDNMNKKMDTEKLSSQDNQIDYLKGYKKRRKLLIKLSILLTIIVLSMIFLVNVFNSNILLDIPLYVDVNKFNVEYMYIKENQGINSSTGETYTYKTLEVYLYSEEYKDNYLTGSYKFLEGDKDIYYNISSKKLPKGVEYTCCGLETSFKLEDSIERIYIKDTKNNTKEIWNKNIKVQSEEEWEKWYIDSYVPKEIRDLYNMSYENISVSTSVWKDLYNRLINCY